MSGAVDYLARRRGRHRRRHRRRRLLHGRDAHVPHRRQPRPTRSRRVGARSTGSRGRHGARLGRADRGGARATWPSTTTSSGPTAARALEAKLQGLGKDVTFTVHPGTGHAFMGPHNALGTLDEAKAAEIWPGVLAFLHEQLG